MLLKRVIVKTLLIKMMTSQRKSLSLMMKSDGDYMLLMPYLIRRRWSFLPQGMRTSSRKIRVEAAWIRFRGSPMLRVAMRPCQPASHVKATWNCKSWKAPKSRDAMVP